MKIAIISDIHGNFDALGSVLDDIKKESCDKIFCLGDIIMAGPEPIETADKILALMQSKDFYIIQGNTDKMLSVFSFDTYNELLKINAVMASAYLADGRLIGEDIKLFLKSLPEKKEIELFGKKILLVHGSPRKNNENIYPDMPVEKVEEMIKETEADVIFCGHTHIPCGYQTNTGQTVVNAGSVGRPLAFGANACYAIMTINEKDGTFKMEHKFVKYDKESASRKVLKRGFDGCEKLAEMLLNPITRYPQ